MVANTIAEVIDQLEMIVKTSIINSDRSGYFASLYKNVTIAVSDKIKEGYFEDNVRMEKLDVVFANRYLEAYDQFKAGKPCTLSWQLAFDATMEWKPMVIHHLVAGMNAHIGLDLGIATATVAPGNAINAIQHDFNKINIILNGLMEEVKKDLFDMYPLSSFIAKWRRENLENELAGFSMQVARDAAWQVALAYAPLQSPEERSNYIVERDKKVAAFGNKVLSPGKLVNTLMYVFRLFEFGSIAKKIRRLDEK
jgi:hypothetical protein